MESSQTDNYKDARASAQRLADRLKDTVILFARSCDRYLWRRVGDAGSAYAYASEIERIYPTVYTSPDDAELTPDERAAIVADRMESDKP